MIMKKFFAKLGVMIILTATLSLAFSQSVFADDQPTNPQPTPEAAEEKEPEPFIPNNDSLKNLKFNVGDVLSLDTEDQAKSYVGKKNPPIIELILAIIVFATKVIGSVAIIILIIGGFMFMFSQGNEQNLSNAKDVIKYAIIGLIATFSSYIVVLFVQSLFFDAGV